MVELLQIATLERVDTMKKLFVIRHAKSSWKDESLNDFDRPLNKRGKIDAPLMAKKLKKMGIKPDIILASPALRTKTTAQIIASELNSSKLIRYDDELYEADAQTLMNKIREIGSNHETIFLVGHNPGLSDFLNILVGFDENLPTCAIAQIDIDCEDLKELDRTCSKLVSLNYPKMYK